MPKSAADCRHPRRRRTRPSCRRRRTETISFNRRAAGDFPRDGTVLQPSPGHRRATGGQSGRCVLSSTTPCAACNTRLRSKAARRARPRCVQDLKRWSRRSPTSCSFMTPPAPFVSPRIDFARDRCGFDDRRGHSRHSCHRHDQACRRQWPHRSDARARAPADCADAPVVPLRCDPRGAPARCARGTRRFHRRCGAGRMGGIDGGDV